MSDGSPGGHQRVLSTFCFAQAGRFARTSGAEDRAVDLSLESEEDNADLGSDIIET